MNSENQSSCQWNIVSKKKKKNNKGDDIIVFFKKIKKELDGEFFYLNKKQSNSKINKKENKESEKIKQQNIFSLLLSDSD